MLWKNKEGTQCWTGFLLLYFCYSFCCICSNNLMIFIFLHKDKHRMKRWCTNFSKLILCWLTLEDFRRVLTHTLILNWIVILNVKNETSHEYICHTSTLYRNYTLRETFVAVCYSRSHIVIFTHKQKVPSNGRGCNCPLSSCCRSPILPTTGCPSAAGCCWLAVLLSIHTGPTLSCLESKSKQGGEAFDLKAAPLTFTSKQQTQLSMLLYQALVQILKVKCSDSYVIWPTFI